MGFNKDGQAVYELYRYTPSLAAAVLFTVLFVLATLHHFYQIVRTRSWYFIVFVIGGVFQIIGYICRAPAHKDKENIPLYSISTIMILLAPPLYAASIYMTLGRLIVHLDAEKLSMVPVKWLTIIFVTGDVIGFLMQAAGGGIMASGTLSSINTGEHITIGGLAIQLVFFSVFIIASTIFHRRIRNNPTEKSVSRSSSSGVTSMATWETIMIGLYIASILILIRSIFRLIEYAQGNDGYIISHEAFMYVFDSTLMLFAMIAMSIFHPSRILSQPTKPPRASRRSRSANKESPLFPEVEVQDPRSYFGLPGGYLAPGSGFFAPKNRTEAPGSYLADSKKLTTDFFLTIHNQLSTKQIENTSPDKIMKTSATTIITVLIVAAEGVYALPSTGTTPLRNEASKQYILIGSRAITPMYLNDPEFAAVLANQFNILSPENKMKCSETGRDHGDRNSYEALGLEVAIAELDDHTLDNAIEANIYGTVFSESPNAGITNLSIWGFTDKHAYTWVQGAKPLMFDQCYKPKSEFYATHAALTNFVNRS
ncbi:Glycoside hydrolase, superfamily [Penicillium expansum]|uniref:endo-1,4-beta-xylanase n=1 Tax=Penicillium expansum TaxID=27334 RepID=A0A0A2JV86_PENEN|nr:Glycoside hydrolase, superfamily [Penicillium expansum]KGO58568.1 Glycoside hydrolase, superfamily [Penicillium expansum]